MHQNFTEQQYGDGTSVGNQSLSAEETVYLNCKGVASQTTQDSGHSSILNYTIIINS